VSADVPFARDRAGRLVVRLRGVEVELLRSLAGELTELLGEAARDDPAVARLFPRAYLDPTEEEAEGRWQALAGPDLLRSRLDALAGLVAALGAEPDPPDAELVLDDEQVGQWLGVLNDARLALGSRLGIEEDDEVPDEADTGAAAHARRVYGWLTHLEAELVDVLLGELPEDPAPDAR
jgi:hypothetical protein